MSGIYVHVPFCRTACHYCDFHFSTSLSRVESYVKALSDEISLRKSSGEWDGFNFSTLYFGGGTPSVLSSDQILKLSHSILSAFSNSDGWSEATIEVNPEDVNEASLEGWRNAGFNRLSIGIQSFDDNQLNWMNRKHSSADALRAVELAQKGGWNRISIDLIYGLPQKGRGLWKRTVDLALTLPIDHISCYALTIEPRTVLGYRVSKGLEIPTTDLRVEEDYFYICKAANNAGFEHYEVSNWAKGKDGQAEHNSAYWSGAPYLGLGPGAHGFKDSTRYSVISNNPKYIDSILKGKLPDTIEELTALDRCNESLMTGLRTSKGVDFDELERVWGFNPKTINIDAWQKWNSEGALLTATDNLNRQRICETKWLIGDSIASDLFIVK